MSRDIEGMRVALASIDAAYEAATDAVERLDRIGASERAQARVRDAALHLAYAQNALTHELQKAELKARRRCGVYERTQGVHA